MSPADKDRETCHRRRRRGAGRPRRRARLERRRLPRRAGRPCPAAGRRAHLGAARRLGGAAREDRHLARHRRRSGAAPHHAHRRRHPAPHPRAGGRLPRRRDRPRRLRLQHSPTPSSSPRWRRPSPRARSPGARPSSRRSCPAMSQSHLTLSTGDTLAARLVVAADGRRSKVRDERRHRHRELALRSGGAGLQSPPYGRGTTTPRPSSTPNAGPFTLVPLPGHNRSSLVWVDRPAETERRLALGADELAAEIEAQRAVGARRHRPSTASARCSRSPA